MELPLTGRGVYHQKKLYTKEIDMKPSQHLLLWVAGMLLAIGQLSLAAPPKQGANQQLEWNLVREFPLANRPVDIAHSLDNKYAFVLTDKNEVLVYDAAGMLLGSIPVEKGVNSITIDPQGQFLHLGNSENSTFSTLAIDHIVSINDTGSPMKGEPDAPVQVAVFSDFQ
jgi:hypothetical protein